MSSPPQSYERLQSDVMALLAGSAELAAWEPSWSAATRVFEGLSEEPSGRRNVGRLPMIDVGLPIAYHEELSSADYAGRVRVRLRCRFARDWSETANASRAGAMFHCVWQTLSAALQSGTANCSSLCNGRIEMPESPREIWDRRAVAFDVLLTWDAPLGK